jgi:iron complex outermembrane receptor protein
MRKLWARARLGAGTARGLGGVVLAVAICVWAAVEIRAQTQTAATTAPGKIPEIIVTAPKAKQAKLRRAAPTHAAAAPLPANQAPTNAPAPLQQVAAVGKTGTKLADLPQSVVIVPREVVREQGGTSLRDAVRDVSGINEGGSSSYGFFDRFTIRGLDARIYSDGFPDGDQFNGFPHSINGVERIEVLKGPGSALFGSTTPGGTIDIIHFAPSSVPAYGTGVQVGSFGSWSDSIYATGPTTIPGLNYRVDGLLQHSDGFRELDSANYEIRPVLSWTGDNHVVTFALDLRHIERTPDSYGIVYVNGPPLAAVANTAKYSTPFAMGDQDFERATLTDAWWITNGLSINNRFSFLHRDVDILRNSGGTVSGIMLTSRQLREQIDHDNDFTYQFEPLWKFQTGSIGHTLLTGAQVEWQSIDDNRATASLPNISNIYAPVIPETSTAGLTFLRDAKHSGMIDDLRALYLSAYATDQIDVTDQWKVRLGARQDDWIENLTPQVFVPGRFDPNGNLFEPDVTESRTDTPVSWSVGTLYKIFPGIAPFVGVSKSYLTNFNSEATQTGVFAPESGLEYEAGVKFSTADGSFVLTTAAFKILRNNVFTENTATVPIQISFNAQESRGVDADMQLQLTSKWKLLANAIAQDAVLTAVPLTPSQVGNRPVGVPAHVFNLWTTYDFSIAGIDGFEVGGGLSYNDKTFGNTANTGWIPASTVVDALFGYYAAHWDAQFGAKNIANVTYYTVAQSAGGFIGQPRTFYLKADWHY